MLKSIGVVASSVILYTLMLIGCKNGLLEHDDATVNGVRGAGSRTASITVTNLISSNNQGAFRSIVADPIEKDLTRGTYVLVAEGFSSAGNFQPTVVAFDAGGGVDLKDLTPAVWTIDFSLYDEDKLVGGNPGVNNTFDKVAEAKARVLGGTIVIDLTDSNSSGRITLTSDDIDGEGNVSLTFNLTQEDWDVLITGGQTTPQNNGYTIKIGIYDPQTGIAIASTGAPGVPFEKDYSAITAKDAIGGGVGDAFTGNFNNGVYIVRVTITDSQKKQHMWTDKIHVEANRDISSPIDLPRLIGVGPTAPSNFGVFFDKDNSGANSYRATFKWTRESFNETGFELQIFDVTNSVTINSPGNITNILGAGLTSSTTLWNEVKATADVQTSSILTPANMDSNRVTFPLYVKDGQGTLNAGSETVSYDLDISRIYAVRIRSTNTSGSSDWVTYDPTTNTPDVHNGFPEFKWIIGAAELIYKLDGFLLLKDGATGGPTYANPGDKITSDKQYEMFDPDANTTLKYTATAATAGAGGYVTITGTGVADKYRFYLADFNNDPAQEDKSLKSFNGWSADKLDGGTNPITSLYFGFGLVTLSPSGFSGTSGVIDEVITAGIFKDFVREDTVWLQMGAAGGGGLNWTNKNLTWYKTTGTSLEAKGRTATSIGKVAIGGQQVVTIELHNQVGVGVSNPVLYIITGEDPDTAPGQFTDTVNSKPRTTNQVTYTIENVSGNVMRKKIVNGTGAGNLDLTGLLGGNYVLRVSNNFGNFLSEKSFPIVIKYTTDVVQ